MQFVFRICISLGSILAGGFLTLATASVRPAERGAANLRVLDTEIGDATFYAPHFDGRKTASGRLFDGKKAMAAHRHYPFGTVVRVTNLRSGQSINVVIVDRGPFGKNRREGAIIDLSPSAAKKLGIIRRGQARVKVEVLAWGHGGYVSNRR